MPIEHMASGDRPHIFHLRGESVSYVLAVTKHGHLEQIHFGRPLGALTPGDVHALEVKYPVIQGVTYHPDDPSYSLDYLPLEWSGLGKGDNRTPAVELKQADGTWVSDFRYAGHEILPAAPAASTLPTAHTTGPCLQVDLADGSVRLSLFYVLFDDAQTVTRRAVLTNDAGAVEIRSLASQLIDLPNRPWDLVTFDGSWISEGHMHVRPVMPGIYVNSSISGYSSAEHNPGVLLAEPGATEERGEVYAFNLIYSGNHRTVVELSRRELVRVVSGINPTGFEWTLDEGETFETPEATLTWSDRGFGGSSTALHTFVSDHVVRGHWAKSERPILVNNWEATMFDVDHSTIVSMAKSAARLGAELFVLDDGWFSTRTSDTAGLGDWDVNTTKFPHGLRGIGDAVRATGMQFGIWVEPEMVNPDSDLYRTHPDWAIAVPGRTPSEGRHQYVLDLSRMEVRDYLVEAIGSVIDESGARYVKWDCNRNISDIHSHAFPAGEVSHRIIMGLYEVLSRVFTPRPHVLLESCASGGNRFDLGMLCYSPQIWTSDDTDPIERLDIQLGLSHLYPQSTMGAHVTASPSAQTLRATPLTTRFNVAALGVLGYELDPRRLSRAERRTVREQIAFYKANRKLLQHGRLRRLPTDSEHRAVAIGDDARCIVGHYQLRSHAAQPSGTLPLPPLDPAGRYRVTNMPQKLDLGDFGALVEHLVPLRFDGVVMKTAARTIRFPDGNESCDASGAALAQLRLAPQYEGTGVMKGQRILGDFGSRMYTCERIG